jgi:hypothetical protein
VVGEHDAGVRRIGQHAERVEIGHQPNLPDRAHVADRLELIQRIHRLHRDGQPDAGGQPSLETVARRCLGPDRSVVAAPQKANQADIVLLRSRDDLLGVHVRRTGSCTAAPFESAGTTIRPRRGAAQATCA